MSHHKYDGTTTINGRWTRGRGPLKIVGPTELYDCCTTPGNHFRCRDLTQDPIDKRRKKCGYIGDQLVFVNRRPQRCPECLEEFGRKKQEVTSDYRITSLMLAMIVGRRTYESTHIRRHQNNELPLQTEIESRYG